MFDWNFVDLLQQICFDNQSVCNRNSIKTLFSSRLYNFCLLYYLIAAKDFMQQWAPFLHSISFYVLKKCYCDRNECKEISLIQSICYEKFIYNREIHDILTYPFHYLEYVINNFQQYKLFYAMLVTFNSNRVKVNLYLL